MSKLRPRRDSQSRRSNLDWTADVVWLEGCKSHVGTNRPEIRMDGEHPLRSAKLRPFGISRFAVSVGEFARFVEETDYCTDADRFGWSYVFRGLLPHSSGAHPVDMPWWISVDGANWKHPLGRDLPAAHQDHPVTHVSHVDATAFAEWSGGRLPSEAEWEHAARGGQFEVRYPWGDDEPDDERNIHCNIWQGNFPDTNTLRDGFYGTAPVRSFEPNSIGLFNMSGNVWEWCSCKFRVRSVGKVAKARNAQAKTEREHVLKGGSFLCHRSYCWRYRIAARSGRSHDTSTCNAGFRLAFDA